MSLRRSPRRTAAFLAANRSNAQKSTGPRTAIGKQRSGANLLGKSAHFRRRSRLERAGYFVPRDPPELASFDRPDQEPVSWAAEMLRVRRQIGESHLRALWARSGQETES